MIILKKICWTLKDEWSSIVEFIGLLLGGLGILSTQNSLMKLIFIIIIIIGLIIVGFKVIERYLSYDKNAYPTKEEINDFMHNWLESNGKSVVFTRDMSWGNDGKVNDVLKTKARNKELTLVLSSQNQTSKELEKLGATVIEYGHLDYTPAIIFTIVDYQTMNSKVAIGQKDEQEIHRINKYSKNDAPIFYLATDLINLISKLEKKVK